MSRGLVAGMIVAGFLGALAFARSYPAVAVASALIAGLGWADAWIAAKL